MLSIHTFALSVGLGGVLAATVIAADTYLVNPDPAPVVEQVTSIEDIFDNSLTVKKTVVNHPTDIPSFLEALTGGGAK